MGRIVATPTAGSCGIMPGCLLTLMEDKGMDRKDVVMSMFTAAASEWFIAKNACIAGAQGGWPGRMRQRGRHDGRCHGRTIRRYAFTMC